jgi:hypothetical protein
LQARQGIIRPRVYDRRASLFNHEVDGCVLVADITGVNRAYTMSIVKNL